MNWLLYLIGFLIVAWAISVLEGANWHLQAPSVYLAGFAFFTAIIVAAFGAMIGLLKKHLAVLHPLLGKR